MRLRCAAARGQGAPDALYSAFHLTYSMVLNLLRAEGASPEALMRASFRQFQAEKALPQLAQAAAAAQARRCCGTRNPEPGTRTQGPRTGTTYPEPRIWNPEPRTRNPELRTTNHKPRNPDLSTWNPAPGALNPEPRPC